MARQPDWNAIDRIKTVLLEGRKSHIRDSFMSSFSRIGPGHYSLSSLNGYLKRDSNIDRLIIDSDPAREHVPEGEIARIESGIPIRYRTEGKTSPALLKILDLGELGIENADSLLVSRDPEKRKLVSKHIDIRGRKA